MGKKPDCPWCSSGNTRGSRVEWYLWFCEACNKLFSAATTPFKSFKDMMRNLSQIMKSITTLVKDIYSLVESGKFSLDAKRLGDMISNRLSRGQESGDALRISNLGEKCVRKLWYRQNKPEAAEPLDGPTLLKFNNGDILEETVLSLAEQAGHEVAGRQDTIDLHGVIGHRDAIIDGVMVDVKSANSRGMHKFTYHRLEHDDPFGYLDQLDAYLAGSKADPALKVRGEMAFLAVDKELGKLHLDVYKAQNKPWESIISKLRSTIGAAAPPPRAYNPVPDGSSGNMKIPMECSYCQFKNICYQDSNGGSGLRKYLYSNGPRWLTQVIRTPKPDEQTQIRIEKG